MFRHRSLYLAPALFVAWLVLQVSTASAQKPVPHLPQKYVDTTLVFPKNARYVYAHDSNQLTQAIQNAMQADIIVLDPGVTYIGYWKLPPTSPLNNQPPEYTYIVTANFNQKHPPAVRVNPVTDAYRLAVPSPASA